MKILFYNWVQFDNDEKLGGGVTVYIKNLIEYLLQNRDYTIYFLSSGHKYNPLAEKPYIKKSKNIFGSICHSYEVINSDIIGPLGTLCWDLDRYLDDTRTTKVMEDFIVQNGPFDIIHVHNIGGFGQNFLKLKEKFPNTKFIFDLHNYNSICMNSYLFKHNKGTMCLDYCEGKDCLECFDNLGISKKIYKQRVKVFWKENFLEKMKYKFTHKFKNCFKNDYEKYYVTTHEDCRNNSDSYKKFRENNVKYINEYFDTVLAVSQKVKDVAVKYGINSEKIKVSYIGTKFAENICEPKTFNKNKKFKIAYMGYANVLKGYFFLLDALSKISPDIAKNIDLVFAAKGIKSQKEVKEKLAAFNSVTLINGYNHSNIKTILSDADLGIVPVLWDDNLPQVAIEIVSNGVPVLCSDFGGASELSSSESFKFKGGNIEDFQYKLINIMQNPELLKDYWSKLNPLMTMEKHVQNLEKIYGIDSENHIKHRKKTKFKQIIQNIFSITNDHRNHKIIKIIGIKLSISKGPKKFAGVIKLLDLFIPKNKRKIVFCSFPDFSDNAKEYYEYLLANHPDEYELIWLCQNNPKNINIPTTKKSLYSISGIMELLSAKYTVNTFFALEKFISSPQRKNLQLWHGMPFKTIGYLEKNIPPKYFKAYTRFKNAYYFVTSDIFKLGMSVSFMAKPDNIFITGQPRTDCIYSGRNKEKIHRFLNLDKYKKVILYTPTYKECKRKDGGKDIDCEFNNIFYMNDYNEEKFYSELEKNNILLVIKPHPFEENFYRNYVGNGGLNHPNIKMVYNKDMEENKFYFYEFFSCADLMITDFSSIGIDYLITKKPIIFLNLLSDEYNKNRGFTLPDNYEIMMPGEKVQNFEQLLSAIEDALTVDSQKDTREKMLPLLHKYTDSKASERIYDIMRGL